MNKATQTSSGKTRRDFLRDSMLISGVGLGGLTVARAAHAAGSETLRLGLIGCGGRGAGAVSDAFEADPGTVLVAMTDVFEDRLQTARKLLKDKYPDRVLVDNERCFVGFNGYRQVIESGVDVVLIACASKFHPKYMAAAIAAGKHVFVEKPHATELPDLALVEKACNEAKEKGLSVVSGLCWRYHEGVRETMKRVHDGAIGQIVAIQETYMRSPYRLIEFEEGLSEIAYQYRNWYHFVWLSGDDIAQSLIHSMDKGSWALGDIPPLWAYGVGGRAASVGRVYGDCFDHFSIVFEYPNGVRMYAIGRAINNCYNEVSDIFYGTEGKCDLLRHRIDGKIKWEYKGPKSNMYVAEHQALFGAIRSGNPVNNGHYMILSTRLALMGQLAAYSGRQVTWEEVLTTKFRHGPEEADFNTEPPVRPDQNGIYPVRMPGVFDYRKQL
ncbi:MAG: Gfo/Idh/MocA family oxidoreductase [Thermoguttaceae bacterium]|nr:Gfo/Idh/MocA family oxidoreductase [Thermoguttaceae bacterium]MDW8078977.1 Gfo/Idh/MocA family oxidoreductase [Thermoguttaceae bacterium]